MAQRPRRTTIGYAIAVGVLLALFVTFSSLVGMVTEWLWFASLGQPSIYQTRLWSQVGLWLAGDLLVILDYTRSARTVNRFYLPCDGVGLWSDGGSLNEPVTRL